jgi:hypothetical protein
MFARKAVWLMLWGVLGNMPSQGQARLASQEYGRPTGTPPSATRAGSTDSPPPTIFDCRNEQVNTSWALPNPPLNIESSFIQFTAIGMSFVELRARNFQTYPIEALALIVEYADNEGRTVERIPLIAGTEEAIKTFRPPFSSETDIRPEFPVNAGDSVRLQAASTDGIRTANCPSSARITYSMIRYASGDTKTLSIKDWQLDPRPRMIPMVEQFPIEILQPPVVFLTSVKINASGLVSDVISMGQGQEPIVKTIRRQMQQGWKFHPALRAGQPVDSELTVLFRVHTEMTASFPETKPLLSPVVLVELFPDKQNPGKLAVAYGGRF